MMGRLRRKFAAVAMAAVTVVLLSMVVCINVVNYMNLCERADERLEVLSEGGGAFPDEEVAAAASVLAERAATRRAARPPRVHARGAVRDALLHRDLVRGGGRPRFEHR